MQVFGPQFKDMSALNPLSNNAKDFDKTPKVFYIGCFSLK